MNKPINKKNKTIVIIFTICLVLVTIFSIVFPLSQSKDFYLYSFSKNNTAQMTGYTSSELSKIASHIIRFLQGKVDSFHYEINDLHVFSNQAIIHMKDVRDLMYLLQNFMVVIFILFVVLAIYIYVKRKQFKDILFKYASITIGIIAGIILIFGIIALIDFTFAFNLFHRIIFPNEVKFNDSFFGKESNYPELPYIDNVMLVRILSNNFFIDFAIIVIIVTLIVVSIYLLMTWFYKRSKKLEKQINE